MNIDMSLLAPYIWIVVAVLAIIVVFILIRFFWHHVLRYLLHGCVAILGIIVLLALFHYIFKLF